MKTKKYLTTRKIDDEMFSEIIHARSLVEAQLFCVRAGTDLAGEYMFSIPNFPGAWLLSMGIIVYKNYREGLISI